MSSQQPFLTDDEEFLFSKAAMAHSEGSVTERDQLLSLLFAARGRSLLHTQQRLRNHTESPAAVVASMGSPPPPQRQDKNDSSTVYNNSKPTAATSQRQQESSPVMVIMPHHDPSAAHANDRDGSTTITAPPDHYLSQRPLGISEEEAPSAVCGVNTPDRVLAHTHHQSHHIHSHQIEDEHEGHHHRPAHNQEQESRRHQSTRMDKAQTMSTHTHQQTSGNNSNSNPTAQEGGHERLSKTIQAQLMDAQLNNATPHDEAKKKPPLHVAQVQDRTANANAAQQRKPDELSLDNSSSSRQLSLRGLRRSSSSARDSASHIVPIEGPSPLIMAHSPVQQASPGPEMTDGLKQRCATLLQEHGYKTINEALSAMQRSPAAQRVSPQQQQQHPTGLSSGSSSLRGSVNSSFARYGQLPALDACSTPPPQRAHHHRPGPPPPGSVAASELNLGGSSNTEDDKARRFALAATTMLLELLETSFSSPTPGAPRSPAAEGSAAPTPRASSSAPSPAAPSAPPQLPNFGVASIFGNNTEMAQSGRLQVSVIVPLEECHGGADQKKRRKGEEGGDDEDHPFQLASEKNQQQLLQEDVQQTRPQHGKQQHPSSPNKDTSVAAEKKGPPGVRTEVNDNSVFGRLRYLDDNDMVDCNSPLRSPRASISSSRASPSHQQQQSAWKVECSVTKQDTGRTTATSSATPSAPLSRTQSSGALDVTSSCSSSVTFSRRATQVRHDGKWMINERYIFDSQLGRGAQGSVWKCYDRTQDRYVAVKIVPRTKINQQGRRVAVLHGPLGGDPAASSADGSITPQALLPCVTEQLKNVQVAEDAIEKAHYSPLQRVLSPAPQRTGGATLPLIDGVRSPPEENALSPFEAAAAAAATAAAEEDHMNISFSFLSMNRSGSVKLLRQAYTNGPQCETSVNLVAEMVVGLLRHDYLLGIEEIIDAPESSFVLFVTRLLDGPPCRLMQLGETDSGPIPPLTVARWAHNIASALDALHSCRIVHCDVKLDNMLRDLQRGDRLILADFGLAALHEERVEVLGGGNGTFAFWAPEIFQLSRQQRGRSNNTALLHTTASDCYSLGLCLYAMLFGHFPYWTENVRSQSAWRDVVLPAVQQKGHVILPAGVKSDLPPTIRNDAHQMNALSRLHVVIEALLQADPGNRMTAATAVQWLTPFV